MITRAANFTSNAPIAVIPASLSCKSLELTRAKQRVWISLYALLNASADSVRELARTCRAHAAEGSQSNQGCGGQNGSAIASGHRAHVIRELVRST